MGIYHGASVVPSSPKAQKSQAVNDLVRDIIGYGVKEESKNPQRQEIRQADTSGRAEMGCSRPHLKTSIEN
jgi:hypothetical protein